MGREETIQVNYRLRGKGARGIESAYKNWVEAWSEITPYVASSDGLNHLPNQEELIFLKDQAKARFVDHLKKEDSEKAYNSMVKQTLTSENITV